MACCSRRRSLLITTVPTTSRTIPSGPVTAASVPLIPAVSLGGSLRAGAPVRRGKRRSQVPGTPGIWGLRSPPEGFPGISARPLWTCVRPLTARGEMTHPAPPEGHRRARHPAARSSGRSLGTTRPGTGSRGGAVLRGSGRPGGPAGGAGLAGPPGLRRAGSAGLVSARGRTRRGGCRHCRHGAVGAGLGRGAVRGRAVRDPSSSAAPDGQRADRSRSSAGRCRQSLCPAAPEPSTVGADWRQPTGLCHHLHTPLTSVGRVSGGFA